MGTVPRQLTGEEAALYDRQIRLWGLEAQRQLASSHVLLIGSVCSLLGHELAKNVVLSGVARLALCSDGGSTESSFLGDDMEQTAANLREMNPHVDVQVAETAAQMLGEFKVVCAVGLRKEEELKLASRCRELGVCFMCGRVCGKVGWLFFDLGESYRYQEKIRGGKEAGQMKDGEVSFCTYKAAIETMWGNEGRSSEYGWHLRSALMEFEQEAGYLPLGAEDCDRLVGIYKRLCEEKKPAKSNEALVKEVGKSCRFTLAPVAAVVGGMWGREVIKVVSGRDEPLNNFFFFNVGTTAGSVEHIAPKKA